MAKWQFNRAGSWSYPTLGFVATYGDVVEADLAPDAYWDAVDSSTPATIPVVPTVGAVEPASGKVLTYNAASNQGEYKTLAEAGLDAAMEAIASDEDSDFATAERARQDARYAPIGSAGVDPREEAQRQAAAITKRMTAFVDAFATETVPDVTVGAMVAEATATTIASPTTVMAYDLGNSRVNSALRITDTRAVQASVNWPRSEHIAVDKTIITFAPGIDATTAMTVATAYNGTKLDLLLRNNASGGQFVQVVIDGIVAYTVTTADFTGAGIAVGSFGRLPLTFTAARPRTIALRFLAGGMEFRGFTRESANPLYYPGGSKGARILVVGDSFTEGTGSAASGIGYVQWMQQALGWIDVWRCGSGSTGYTEDGTRLALIDRYTNDIIDQDPNICIIAMGLNDIGDYPADPVAGRAAWATIWDAIESNLPACEVVIVGPWPNTGGATPSADLVTMDAAMQEDAEARGLRFISPIQQGVTFTRYDATHPDDAGHKKIGLWLAGNLEVPYIAA